MTIECEVLTELLFWWLVGISIGIALILVWGLLEHYRSKWQAQHIIRMLQFYSKENNKIMDALRRK